MSPAVAVSVPWGIVVWMLIMMFQDTDVHASDVGELFLYHRRQCNRRWLCRRRGWLCWRPVVAVPVPGDVISSWGGLTCRDADVRASSIGELFLCHRRRCNPRWLCWGRGGLGRPPFVGVLAAGMCGIML